MAIVKVLTKRQKAAHWPPFGSLDSYSGYGIYAAFELSASRTAAMACTVDAILTLA